MKTYRLKKLFKGTIASVRDYIVEDCIKNKQGLRINYNNQIMELSYEELINKKFQIVKKSFTSKFGSQDYCLIDFQFKPNK